MMKLLSYADKPISSTQRKVFERACELVLRDSYRPVKSESEVGWVVSVDWEGC